MSKYIIYILSILFVFSAPAQADVLKCMGVYNNGNPMHVVYDESANLLDVDGDIHSIQSHIPNNGFATQDFENSSGKTVYISFNNNNKNIYLQVIEPLKQGINKLIDTVHLSCVKQ